MVEKAMFAFRGCKMPIVDVGQLNDEHTHLHIRPSGFGSDAGMSMEPSIVVELFCFLYIMSY